MVEYIYKEFLYFGKCGKYFGFWEIDYNEQENKLLLPTLTRKILQNVVIIGFIAFMFTDTFYYMATDAIFDKTELLYIFEIPFMLLYTMYITRYMLIHQKIFLDVLESFQVLDTVLSKYYTYRSRNRNINYLIWLLNLIYFIIFFLGIFAYPFHFITPQFKMYTIQATLGAIIMYYIILILQFKALLADRTYILNKILKVFIEKKSFAPCHNCNEGYGEVHKVLCRKHQIK